MDTISNKKALVLFSGGQDSTTCLYWAKECFDHVEALNISYGQRHKAEIKSARIICNMAKVHYEHIECTVFEDICDSALMNETENISQMHRSSDKLPASFVPGRNILFLTIAAAMAFKKDIPAIVTGVCQTDFSGYPDCRAETITKMEETLRLGMDYPFKIHTPLMNSNKKQTVVLAELLSGCMEALAFSHTCYEGQIPPCGECPACMLRAKGFKEAGIIDPLIRRTGV